MTKGLLPQSVRRWVGRLTRFAGPLTGLALVIGAGGCATGRPAALVVERPAMAVSASGSEGKLRLKLVAYNIWGLPSWMTGARPDRYPRIARELERLDPDIILLQEAWTAAARKSAPACGPWAIARAAGQHSFFQQTGLVTLSKFPIIGGGFYPFSRSAFPDRLVNKGVLKVTLQMSGGQVLNVWNVHLQDVGPVEIQRWQARELIARVQAAEDGQIADLVGGDFNCTPESSVCRELVKALGPPVQKLNGAEPFVTWDGLSAKPGVGQAIDYVFIRERTNPECLQAVARVAFTAASVKERLSDHLGIIAEVNWSPVPSLANTVGPPVKPLPLPAVAADQAMSAGGE